MVPELIEVTVPVEEMLQNCDEQEEKYLPSPEEMVLKNAVEGSKETHSNSNNKKKNINGNNTSATTRIDDKSEPTTPAGKRRRERSESPSDRPDEEDEGGSAYVDLLKERKRLLRLEARMTYEVKRKEAQYWHLKTLQLVSDIKAGLAIKNPPKKTT